MQTNQLEPSRFRRTLNDLAMAEIFMVQATIESAIAIGDGINELGKQLSDEGNDTPLEAVSKVLQHTADQAIEPYTTRFGYLRDMFTRP